MEEVAAQANVSPDALADALTPPDRDARADRPANALARETSTSKPVSADPSAVGLSSLLSPSPSEQDEGPDGEPVSNANDTNAEPASEPVAPTTPLAEAGESDKRLYVVDKLLDHDTVDGELLFHVLWYDTENQRETTWEPLENLRRSHVTGYCRRVRMPNPPGLHKCLEG